MAGKSDRPFAVFDIDGTLVRWQLYHAVADNLVKRGIIKGQRFEGIRGARMEWKRRAPGATFRTYELEIIAAYENALGQLSLPELMAAVSEVFDEYKDQVYTYSRDLITQLKAKNYLLFAVSGSQSEIVEQIADYYGFDAFIGTEYARRDERFTGGKIVHAHFKDRALKRLIKKFNVTTKASIGIGDSASDIVMLELVERPIAFNPEVVLFRHAQKVGWQIVLERKNMVYELEKRRGFYVLAKTNAG